MVIIAQVLKEKWLKITGFAHSQTTNKLVNEAANNSARVSGQDRKKTARSRNQSDCRIWRIPPARKLKKYIYISLTFSGPLQFHIIIISHSFSQITPISHGISHGENVTAIFPGRLIYPCKLCFRCFSHGISHHSL